MTSAAGKFSLMCSTKDTIHYSYCQILNLSEMHGLMTPALLVRLCCSKSKVKIFFIVFCYSCFFNFVVENFLVKHLAGSVFSVFQFNGTQETATASDGSVVDC